MKPEQKENPMDRLKDVFKTPSMPVHELSQKTKKLP